MLVITSSDSLSGGCLPRLPGCGWPGWPTGCVRITTVRRPRSMPPGGTAIWRAARGSGSGWWSCSARVVCWSGLVCTASKHACPAIAVACSARCWGPWASDGSGLPGRDCWRSWPVWRAAPWPSAFPGAMWPSDLARVSMRGSSRAARSAKWCRTSRSGSRRRANARWSCPANASKSKSTIRRPWWSSRWSWRCRAASVLPRSARSRCSPRCSTASCRRWICSTAPRPGRRPYRPRRWT